ncbi:MAG: hypothetical protein H0S85_03900 [Desulfovibrionaceae bacterium]|nr:hypothetical protein [Desulfovibrionaceae bacterium]
MRLLGAACALLALAFVLGACATTEDAPAPSNVIEVREPKPAVVYPKPLEGGEELGMFGPRLTLREFLTRTLREEYFSLGDLYAPPPDDFFNMYFTQLHMENAVLHLAKDVVHYSADPGGLAVALKNGNLMVWSGWSCPGVAVPGSSGARFMSWDSASPILAACDADGLRIRLFDLRHCAQVHTIELRSPVTAMALSPKGTWLGAVTEVRDLVVGRSLGNLRKVAVLRFEPAAIGFSPQEGLMLVLDQGGWVTMWAPHAARYVDRFQISPGPYASARFAGDRLHVVTREGRTMDWDLVKRAEVAPDGSRSRFYAEDGVLYYRTWQQRPVKKMHLGRPELAVWLSRGAHMLRVHDIDGGVRYYSATDGSQQPPVEAGDWLPLDMDPAEGFSVDERRFVLADVVFQKDHKRLMCRTVPGQGFFLWWTMVQRPGEYHPHPGKLPDRTNLAADAAVSWVGLEAPENLP